MNSAIQEIKSATYLSVSRSIHSQVGAVCDDIEFPFLSFIWSSTALAIEETIKKEVRRTRQSRSEL
jgi:hypothetical protein